MLKESDPVFRRNGSVRDLAKQFQSKNSNSNNSTFRRNSTGRKSWCLSDKQPLAQIPIQTSSIQNEVISPKIRTRATKSLIEPASNNTPNTANTESTQNNNSTEIESLQGTPSPIMVLPSTPPVPKIRKSKQFDDSGKKVRVRKKKSDIKVSSVVLTVSVYYGSLDNLAGIISIYYSV